MGSRRRQSDHSTGFSLLETRIAVSRPGFELVVGLPSYGQCTGDRRTLAAAHTPPSPLNAVHSSTWSAGTTVPLSALRAGTEPPQGATAARGFHPGMEPPQGTRGGEGTGSR